MRRCTLCIISHTRQKPDGCQGFSFSNNNYANVHLNKLNLGLENLRLGRRERIFPPFKTSEPTSHLKGNELTRTRGGMTCWHPRSAASYRFPFSLEPPMLRLTALKRASRKASAVHVTGVTLPKGPAPALELKKPLKRMAARFFQLSGPAPTLGKEPLICPRASGVGIFASPRNSVMFFLRRA